MANYNSFTTSNYFEVKNIEEFKEEVKKYGGEDFFEYYNNKVTISIYGDLFSDGDDDYDHNEYCKLIQKHIKEEEKVFISSVGHEKLRYLGAYCTIITKDDIIFYNFFEMIQRQFNYGESIF